MSSVFLKSNGRLISGQRQIFRASSSLALPKLDINEQSCVVKDFKSIPGMTKFQLVRAFAPGGKLYKAEMDVMHKKLRAEYGDIYKIPAMFGHKEMVMVFKPDDVEKVYRNEGKFPIRLGLESLHYYRTKVQPDIYDEFKSISSEHNEDWYKTRSLVNPVMMKPGIVKQYIPQVDSITKDFFNMVLKLRDLNSEMPADFGNYLNKWGLESITAITINRRLGLLDSEVKNEQAKQLIQLARRFFTLMYEFEVQPTIWKIYATKSFKELMSIFDDLTNNIVELVDKAMVDLESSPNRDLDESIFGKLVKINKKMAVVMCIDSIFAGIDSTTSAIVGMLHCLATNQEKQDKLREELRRNIPNGTETLTGELMANMPYLRAVIKEGLRHFPPATVISRKIVSDLVLCGHHVPKGTNVVMVLKPSFTSDEHFDRPKQFIPERWLKNASEQCPSAKKANPFAFLPFSFGPRMCVGKRIADMEMEVFITRLIRDYKVEWNYDGIKYKSVLLSVPDDDLKFKITKV